MCKKELIIVRISASYYMLNQAMVTTSVIITTVKFNKKQCYVKNY